MLEHIQRHHQIKTAIGPLGQVLRLVHIQAHGLAAQGQMRVQLGARHLPLLAAGISQKTALPKPHLQNLGTGWQSLFGLAQLGRKIARLLGR